MNTPTASNTSDPSIEEFKFHRNSIKQEVLNNALPIDPNSLIWKHLGSLKGMLLIFRTGLLQNMHPTVSRALEQHSRAVFFANPWNRLLRSIPPILGVVYDEDAIETGRMVRDYHKKIHGTHENGERYHSLNPEVFYWTHATFLEAMISGQDFFATPFTDEQKEQIYRESITWYGRYAVDMSPVHQDYASFKAYWDEMLEKLQPTPVTDFAMQVTRTACPFPYVPKFIWWLVDPILNKTSLWIARGTLPEKPRKALGLTWSRREEKVLRVFSGLVKFSFKLLPREWGYFPRARKGLVRVRKQKLEQQPI